MTDEPGKLPTPSRMLAKWPTLSRLLDEALDLPDDAARAHWLQELPAEHAEHKPELTRLLRAIGSTRFDAPPPLAATDFHPIDTVAGYRLERELGRGGMAAVWLATRPDDPGAAPVALKLPLVSVDSADFLERFARERAFLGQLAHPHIVAFRDAGVAASGQHYLAMEYVEGAPIAEHCDKHALGIAQRLAIFRQVVGAVEHAHACGILHRDLKPSNILVTPQGEARLLDFGVAKVLVEGRGEETTLTRASGRPLTPEYASLEQVAGGTLTAASDVYSLGVVLYELLAGARPPAVPRKEPLASPSGAVAPGCAVALAEGGERKLAQRLRGDLDAVVMKAMRDKPEERYASAEALGKDVDRLLAGEPVVPRGEAMRARARDFLMRHRLIGSLFLILFATAGGMRATHRAASDLQQLVERPVPAAQQAALVTIGSEDYARLFGSRSPLDPARLQVLVARILQGRPAALGVDLDTSDAGFAKLREAFASTNGRIVWARGARPAARGEALAPLPALGPGPAMADTALALVIVDPDDGVARRYSRHVTTSEGTLPTFPYAVARGRAAGPEPRPGDEPLAIRYTRTERPEFPASVVLADGFQWGSRIEDRIVVLGGRYDRADVHRTPLGEMDGIEVVANIVETELRGGGPRPPHVATVVAIGMIELVALLLIFDHLPFFRGVMVAVGGTVAVSAVLALTGILPEWPYAFFALLLAVLNQMGIETVRNQRGTLKAAFAAVKERLSPPRRPDPPGA